MEAKVADMIALDTNVVVRFIMRDDEKQAQRSRDLIANKQVFLSASVLMEAEWVLRSTYAVSPSRIAPALLGLCSLPNVVVERAAVVRRALAAQAAGADFADAIHVLTAEAAGAGSFATFDKSLRRRVSAFAVSIEAISP